MKKSQTPADQIPRELEKIKRQNAELKALNKQQKDQINEFDKDLKLSKNLIGNL